MTAADVLTQPALALVVPALGRRSRSASRAEPGTSWRRGEPRVWGTTRVGNAATQLQGGGTGGFLSADRLG